MRKAYIVNYDLNKTKDYDTLFAEIHKLGGKRVLKSCWPIISSLSATAIRERLLSVMDRYDARGEAAWHNLECTNKWLKENLQSRSKGFTASVYNRSSCLFLTYFFIKQN